MEDVGTRHQEGRIAEADTHILDRPPEGLPRVTGHVLRLEVRILESHRVDAFPVALLVVQAATDTETERLLLITGDLLLRVGTAQVMGVERQVELERADVPDVLQRLPHRVVPGAGRRFSGIAGSSPRRRAGSARAARRRGRAGLRTRISGGNRPCRRRSTDALSGIGCRRRQSEQGRIDAQGRQRRRRRTGSTRRRRVGRTGRTRQRRFTAAFGWPGKGL